MSQDNKSDQQQETPKIHIDSDWKAQARAEKERLASEAAKEAAAPAGAAGPAGAPGAPAEQAQAEHMPAASFTTLVSTIASQALFALGAIPDPSTQRRYVDLDMARFHIDTLKVLEAKTAGNLTDDETDLLNRTLYELRTAYVQLAQRMASL